jgi:hypothetical protein
MLLAALLFLLAGCAYRHVAPEPGEGIAYILNTVVSEHSEPQPVFINGELVAELQPGQFTWFRLAPGSHAFRVAGSPFQGRTLSNPGVKLSAGQTRYLVYDEERDEPYLIEYSETHARRWLRGKRFVPSRSVLVDG